MKKPYPQVSEVVAEYFNGDFEFLQQSLTHGWQKLHLYRLAPNRKYRQSPADWDKREPSTEEFEGWPTVARCGMAKIPDALALDLATKDRVTLPVAFVDPKQPARFIWQRAPGGGPLIENTSILAYHMNRKEVEAFVAVNDTQSSAPMALGKWPWGSYETELLKHLAEATQRFWVNFDPQDSTTAPLAEDVQKWLVERGVSVRIAQAIATILRPDGLKTGPRP